MIWFGVAFKNKPMEPAGSKVGCLFKKFLIKELPNTTNNNKWSVFSNSEQ